MTVTQKDLQLIAESAAACIVEMQLADAQLKHFLYQLFILGRALNPNFCQGRFTTHIVRHLNEQGNLFTAKRVANALKRI